MLYSLILADYKNISQTSLKNNIKDKNNMELNLFSNKYNKDFYYNINGIFNIIIKSQNLKINNSFYDKSLG